MRLHPRQGRGRREHRRGRRRQAGGRERSQEMGVAVRRIFVKSRSPADSRRKRARAQRAMSRSPAMPPDPRSTDRSVPATLPVERGQGQRVAGRATRGVAWHGATTPRPAGSQLPASVTVRARERRDDDTTSKPRRAHRTQTHTHTQRARGHAGHGHHSCVSCRAWACRRTRTEHGKVSGGVTGEFWVLPFEGNNAGLSEQDDVRVRAW
ncbi:hypothetical protein GQ55_8G220000 [Panicum hallii var. hallii]|uniref:Uncharacterized protein n=1 Tax=Panicum hallii var. hallii TaxID=1504633 RepID=A0A2T7CPX2_9POAL|nr:hypothetical protein GQ55_8G220000 [Panicum hallii var. hallii]